MFSPTFILKCSNKTTLTNIYMIKNIASSIKHIKRISRMKKQPKKKSGQSLGASVI